VLLHVAVWVGLVVALAVIVAVILGALGEASDQDQREYDAWRNR